MAVCRTAGVFLSQLRDGFRMCPRQLLHQALPAILALVYGDEAGHTTDYTGKVGVHIALPRLVDDVKHLDVALTAIYFIAISGLPAHCQLGRFILLAQKKLLSFWAEISAAKLIFADPCKRFVLVRKLDFFHFKLDKAVLFQDAVAGVPIQNVAIPCNDGIQKTTLGNDVLLKLLFFLKLQRRNFALELRVNFKLAQFHVGSPFRSFSIYGQWAERSSQTHIVSGNTCRHP